MNGKTLRENRLTAIEGPDFGICAARERGIDVRVAQKKVRAVPHNKARSKMLAQIMSYRGLQSDDESSDHNTDADKLVEGRGDARFVLDVRARWRR